MLTKLDNTQGRPRTLRSCDLECVNVLVDLGLSDRQARVYMALTAAGPARARVAAKLAGIPRQEVYGLLVELQQLGLVTQNLTVPTSYSPMPLSETLTTLLEQKTNELDLMTKKTELLTKKLKKMASFTIDSPPPKPSFGIVSEGERGKKFQNAIQNTQHKIDAISSWERFNQLCFHCEGQLIDALKKNVKLRIITEKPVNPNLPKGVSSAMQKYPNFKLKFSTTFPEVAVMIFDNAQLALAFNPTVMLTKGPHLWTSHPALLVSYNAFFKSEWQKQSTTQ